MTVPDLAAPARKRSRRQAPRQPTRPRRLAALDVGTNSVHMIVVEVRRHGYRVIDMEKSMVQLGAGSLQGRPLTEEAMERAVESLSNMAAIARRWKVQQIIAVATSAVREAPNRRKFINRVAREAGIDVRVISGEEEADYIYRAVRSAVDFHGGTALCIDIGGGSVEMIVGTQAEVFLTRSEPIGALRLTEKFFRSDPPRAREIEECRKHVRKTLKKSLTRIESLGVDFSIGTSGTILALAALAIDSTGDGSGAPDSGLRWLSRHRLSALIDEMSVMTAQERAERFHLDGRRSETILAGAVALEQIMKGLGIDQLRACDAALREGLVEHALHALPRERPQGGVRRAAVLDLAERSNVDSAHANHVARIALRIFDQTQELHHLHTGERELLEYAALLHEIGMHVSYRGHHKHTYYLISHAGLRGFTGDQISIMATVARHSRKSPPTEDHAGFRELSQARQQVVEKLTAILRVADALDRGRRAAVRDVGVEVRKRGLRFSVRCRLECDVEMASAEKRSKYLGQIFERKVRLELR
jgi:exopolyphosphatase / guanosine-5'-triphosphate,3'-diphosphate pyrophosphatase